jgi:hypothetical protein
VTTGHSVAEGALRLSPYRQSDYNQESVYDPA